MDDMGGISAKGRAQIAPGARHFPTWKWRKWGIFQIGQSEPRVKYGGRFVRAVDIGNHSPPLGNRPCRDP